MTDLLPCPFCGSTDTHSNTLIYCVKCGARALGVEQWNTRFDPRGEDHDSGCKLTKADTLGSGDPYADLVISRGPDAVRAELSRLQRKIVSAQQALANGEPMKAIKVLRR